MSRTWSNYSPAIAVHVVPVQPALQLIGRTLSRCFFLLATTRNTTKTMLTHALVLALATRGAAQMGMEGMGTVSYTHLTLPTTD